MAARRLEWGTLKSAAKVNCAECLKQDLPQRAERGQQLPRPLAENRTSQPFITSSGIASGVARGT